MAFVAHIASSTLSIFSLSSISELAPTFTIAILAASIANLFSNLITLSGILHVISSFEMFLIICKTSSFKPSNCRIVSVSSVMLFKQVPKYSGWIKSISSPKSSLITLEPVRRAKSSNISFLFKPKVGASITFIFILPFVLFIAKADKTSGPISPIINKGLLFLITYSNTFCICLMLSI